MESSEASAMQEEEKQPVSKGDLLSSAKVVAGACEAVVHHETDKIDKPKVAGAAADLLGAASAEDKSYGKYLGKAEDYLRKYEGQSEKPPEEGKKKTEDEGESGSGGGGLGGYMKVAQGFFK